MIPIYIWFFGSNHQVTTYFDQKNQHFEFSSFFTTTSIRTSILANLTPLPSPHGAPPLTTHPITCLDVFPTQQAQEWRFLAKFWPFLQYFNFEGCASKTPFLGLDRPTLKKWWGLRTQRKSQLVIQTSLRVQTFCTGVFCIFGKSWTRQWPCVTCLECSSVFSRGLATLWDAMFVRPSVYY